MRKVVINDDDEGLSEGNLRLIFDLVFFAIGHPYQKWEPLFDGQFNLVSRHILGRFEQEPVADK